jgi:predicted site-specific integrase-resolvase
MTMANTKQVIQSRYITLREWAATMFSPVPHVNTLRNWVHDGRIQPQPEKIGRQWRVKRDAKYVND